MVSVVLSASAALLASFTVSAVALPGTANAMPINCGNDVPVSKGGYDGCAKRGYNIVDAYWQVGGEYFNEMIVVGTDYYVYHIWEEGNGYWSGWHRLAGGKAGVEGISRGPRLNGHSGVVYATPPGQLDMIGTDGSRFCIRGWAAAWGNWSHQCA